MSPKKHKIPSPQLLTKSRIPDSVTLAPYRHDPEGKPFKISFQYYNDSVCEIELLVQNGARRILKDIRTIGESHASTLNSNNIKTKPVDNSGDYKRLFSNLPQGVDTLREHLANGTSRIFYFYSGQDLHVIAITENHFETNKQRR